MIKEIIQGAYDKGVHKSHDPQSGVIKNKRKETQNY